MFKVSCYLQINYMLILKKRLTWAFLFLEFKLLVKIANVIGYCLCTQAS